MIISKRRVMAPQNAANPTVNASVSTSGDPKVVLRLFFGAPASVRPICLSIIFSPFPRRARTCCFYCNNDRRSEEGFHLYSRTAKKGYSLKPSFRQTGFSQTQGHETLGPWLSLFRLRRSLPTGR